MTLCLQRRLRLPSLDRRVARGSMQICHKVVMQQLYISRADTQKQFLVISNPSDDAIDLTGYIVADANATTVFRFPRRYILLAGDEVTIWCSPGSMDLDTDNLLQPFLFWTQPDGSLRNAPFFLRGTMNEIILLDPCMIEVASLSISEDGKKDFRVLHCVSSHPNASHSGHTNVDFCVGCLSPAPYPARRQSSRASPSKCDRGLYEVYVFSRYWNVVSDKSLVAHFFAMVVAPMLECLRALLIYTLFAVFQQQRPVLSLVGTSLRDKLLLTVTYMTTCDLATRRLTLWVKSGVLVSSMSFVSMLLDQLAMIATYTSLERLYPDLHEAFRSVLVFELALFCINVAAAQAGFIEYRRHWHSRFKRVAVWDFKWQQLISLCALGREMLLYVLLVLPSVGTASTSLKCLAYLLVPLSAIAMALDFVRGIAMLVHLVKYSLVNNRRSIPSIHRIKLGL